MKKNLRFAMAGTGFWARYQLQGWRELPGCECVALYNRTQEKADALGREFGISATYASYEEMLAQEQLDFVDIVTAVEHHAPMARLAADHGLPVVCQKPMATGLKDASAMVEHARKRGTPLLVNENWRWQSQVRAFSDVLKKAPLGKIWRAHLNYANSFPVFENQPFLRDLERFIITDIGTHILDVMRFPEVFITVEGEDASVSLDFDFNIHVVTRRGTTTTRHPPTFYP